MDKCFFKLSVSGALAVLAAQLSHATLVAYFPVDSATDSSNFLDDIIDDPTHGTTNGTSANNNASIIFDAFRGGDVLSTVEGHRFSAGTQDIDLTLGFTWSLWVKVNSSNLSDSGADVIIGTRQGNATATSTTAWHKMDLGGISAWNGSELTYTNLADDTWHHIAYTGDTTSREIWIDGVMVKSDTSIVVNTIARNLEIGGSSQFSEDVTGLYDDIAIWNEKLSNNRIIELAAGASVIELPNLSLQVDRTTGQTTILGIAQGNTQINYYEITSAGNSLTSTGWNSLADQDFEGNGPANGSGNGWEETGGSGVGAIAEAYLLGSSTIGTNAQVSIGAAYNTSIDAQDLVFLYRSELGLIYEGTVSYINSAILGDTDNDGDVDDSDLGTSFANYTGPIGAAGGKTAADGDTDNDGDVDDSDLGTSFSNYTGPLGPTNVPEPASILLLGAAGALGLSRRRQR